MMPDEHADLPTADPTSDAGASGADAAGTPTPEEFATLIAERDELRARLDEKAADHLRLLAEFQTFRRRTIQEKEDLRRVATEGLVVNLLPVLDTFERSLAAIEAGADAESVVRGIRMVETQLRMTLGGVGLERVAALGAEFNPEVHEAIAADETTDQPDGTVTGEIEAGYRLAGKVVRPARVRIARKPS